MVFMYLMCFDFTAALPNKNNNNNKKKMEKLGYVYHKVPKNIKIIA